MNTVCTRVKLQSLITKREMLRNFRSTQEAQHWHVSMDSLYIQVARDEHEMLVDLAIEALRNRASYQEASKEDK